MFENHGYIKTNERISLGTMCKILTFDAFQTEIKMAFAFDFKDQCSIQEMASNNRLSDQERSILKTKQTDTLLAVKCVIETKFSQ